LETFGFRIDGEEISSGVFLHFHVFVQIVDFSFGIVGESFALIAIECADWLIYLFTDLFDTFIEFLRLSFELFDGICVFSDRCFQSFQFFGVIDRSFVSDCRRVRSLDFQPESCARIENASTDVHRLSSSTRED
jgi:hypothetical protein